MNIHHDGGGNGDFVVMNVPSECCKNFMGFCNGFLGPKVVDYEIFLTKHFVE
jgi:hypothetical protein